MTPAEAAQAVAILLAAFPGAQTTPGTAPLYERKLAPLDKDRCARAIDRLIDTWLYPRSLPTVGNILEVYAELTKRDKGREELEQQVAEDKAFGKQAVYDAERRKRVAELCAAIGKTVPAEDSRRKL